jgi:hypothetical protein
MDLPADLARLPASVSSGGAVPEILLDDPRREVRVPIVDRLPMGRFAIEVLLAERAIGRPRGWGEFNQHHEQQ